jgi:hypothetical protein
MLTRRRNMCAAVRKQHPQLAQLELPQGFRIGKWMPPHAAQRIGVLEAEDAPLRDGGHQGSACPSGRRLRRVRRKRSSASITTISPWNRELAAGAG